MNQYTNEEVAWQRLEDLQREYENSRLIVTRGVPALAGAALVLAERVWWLAGLAMRRSPRRSPAAPVQLVCEECDATSHAA